MMVGADVLVESRISSEKCNNSISHSHHRQKQRQKPSVIFSLYNVLILAAILLSITNHIFVDCIQEWDNDDDMDNHYEEFFIDDLISEIPSPHNTQQLKTDERGRLNYDEIINHIKRGGSSSSSSAHSSNGHKKKKVAKKRRRGTSTPSSSDTKSSSSTNTNNANNNNAAPASANSNISSNIFRKVSVPIPGYGKVEGRREGGIDVWRGIPYAAPPVGTLRFSPPEPAQPWSPAKLDASRFGPDCWQIADPIANPGADSSKMSEDCLYLNVFTPAGHAYRSRQGKFLSGSKLLPVMVWFHGGAFQQGSGNRDEYDGKRLAERDIIVVTINYRLGALGFLVSSRDNIFGNFGLMDQRAAMYWVHENIRAFGGDPDNVTLFGESAGAVMIGLHLLMDGVGTLFHRAIMQSNPLGYTFRSIVVADFIGDALKRSVDCRNLACLRAERVEEIVSAQGALMGVPRSVGDFFTWGPTLTKEMRVRLTLRSDGRFLTKSEDHRLPRLADSESHQQWISEWRHGDEVTNSARWSAVNVSQPMKNLDKIPDDIPILIGSNKHEGELFVHSAFPAPMPKAVYWMFVGALFRDSSSRVLNHYRGYVEEVEKEAEELARKQLEEEESKHEYLENQDQLENEYNMLLAMNATRRREKGFSEDSEGYDGIRALVNTWAKGGFLADSNNDDNNDNIDSEYLDSNTNNNPNSDMTTSQHSPFGVPALSSSMKRNMQDLKDRLASSIEEVNRKQMSRVEKAALRAQQRLEKRIARRKAKALKEAAKVVVDYRPVMSRIIDDYLFRCPGWHFAQLLSEQRERRGKHLDNVFVYRFSQPTHIPGYKECWGKSCHTAELPYVFQAMDIIRSNYSTVGPFAQKEAPKPPEYPYSEMMAAYRGALEDASTADEKDMDQDDHDASSNNVNGNNKNKESLTGIITGNMHNDTMHSKTFQRIIDHFFGDYYRVDADEELASDMAERWASFAKEGNPNYDGSKAEWFSWRYRGHRGKSAQSDYVDAEVSDDLFSSLDSMMDVMDGISDEHDEMMSGEFWEEEYDEGEFTEYFVTDLEGDNLDDEIIDMDNNSRQQSSNMQNTLSSLEARNRLKSLEALSLMEVLEDKDVFRTELRRVTQRKDTLENNQYYYAHTTSRQYSNYNENGVSDQGNRRTKQEILYIARQMGLIASGLSPGGNDVGGASDNMPFFPELLELSWPPEGRLIEKDCTCDMWDRIRCKFFQLRCASYLPMLSSFTSLLTHYCLFSTHPDRY